MKTIKAGSVIEVTAENEYNGCLLTVEKVTEKGCSASLAFPMGGMNGIELNWDDFEPVNKEEISLLKEAKQTVDSIVIAWNIDTFMESDIKECEDMGNKITAFLNQK